MLLAWLGPLGALDTLTVAKVIGVSTLFLFLPLTALTYYIFRRHRRAAELERIFTLLHIEPGVRQTYLNDRSGAYFLCAVAYASVVSGLGLLMLFLGSELGLAALPGVSTGQGQFPRAGSLLICGMAFLGAYLWGLQYVYRRYVLNDLNPGVYYGLSMRMILAAVVAVVLYNMSEALASGEQGGSGVASHLWPALAFLLGMLPQQGVRWLMERLPFTTPDADPTVRPMPLVMIEGLERHDSLRLEELGLDTCYDLAHADFVPLVLKTPYSARQLVDWILQAKLCMYFGDAVRDLRRQGLRTIADLESLAPEEMDSLATETAVTRSALARARAAFQHDREIERLRRIGLLLGQYAETRDELHGSD